MTARSVSACAQLLATLVACMATSWAHAQPTSENSLTAGAVDPPKNLARLNCGARIEIPGANPIQARRQGLSNPGTLLLDDQTLNYQLAAGDTSFLISLHKI